MRCPPVCKVCESKLLLGASLAPVHRLLLQFSDTPLPRLVDGETGTGKGCVAMALHRLGPRAAGPFIRIGCGELSATLIESALYGHERDAFTGAAERRIGLIESAIGGTVFLDELEALPLALQPKLLHVMQHRTLRRVGGLVDIPVDVWFVCATNQPLEELVRAGHFRSDLFYRATACRITIPPLRERLDDLPALVEHFLAGAGVPIARLDTETLRALMRHTWPGNVRELENAVAYAAKLVGGREIRPEHLPPHLFAQPPVRKLTAALTKEDVEALLAATGGDVALAARKAGCVPRHFYRIMESVGVRPPSETRNTTRRLRIGRE